MVEMYEVSKYRYIQTEIYYDQFFHPNICHVCKSTDLSNLISCDRCNLISYCTEEHRKLHRPQHEDICTLIMMFINEDPDWHTRRLYFQDWIKKQDILVRTVQMALGRNLKTYEVQMIMFAKSCFICHQQSNLTACKKCISVNYCNDHISEISSHCDFHCNDLALSLNLDILSLEETTWEATCVKLMNFSHKLKLFNNMDTFLYQYYRKQSEHENSKNFNTYLFTDYISGPLTLYYALKSANLFLLENITRRFIVHIIAANSIDRRSFPAWELFLHLLNEKVKLVIVMIGPELQYETTEHKVCSHCKAADKRLILQSFPLLYHKYVLRADYKRPNIIVGFQAELNYDRSWSKSIKAMKAQDCPLLLTAKSQLKAYLDIIKIGKILGVFVNPTLYNENRFSSYRPYRDFENGYIFFRNSFLIVYKHLNNLIALSRATSNLYIGY